jgi:hypothetical protein
VEALLSLKRLRVAGDSVRNTSADSTTPERFLDRELAKRVCECVPVCVGTSASIGDGAARRFSIGFYGAWLERVCGAGVVARQGRDAPRRDQRSRSARGSEDFNIG